jgi:hypothetical protein
MRYEEGTVLKPRAPKRNTKQQLLFKAGLAAGIVMVLALTGLALYRYAGHRATLEPSPTPRVGNSTDDQPKGYSESPTPTPTLSPTASPAAPITLAKPVLQKSSGNAPGSSVPAGAMMEFVCEGTSNLSCDVILTDRANAARVVRLGAKPIASNGRGQYFATWTWTAQAGSWSVVAKISDPAGNSNVSDAQTLEVK